MNGLKKNKKENKQIKQLNFIRSFFLILRLWTLKPTMFDRKFGFYMNNSPRNRLESSQIRHPDQNMTNIIFSTSYFYIKSRGYVVQFYRGGKYIIQFYWARTRTRTRIILFLPPSYRNCWFLMWTAGPRHVRDMLGTMSGKVHKRVAGPGQKLGKT